MTRLVVFFTFCLIILSCSSKNWREASRESAQIAPKASEIKEPIFQIYYARAFSWRGYFATHPWIAWKLPKDKTYKVAQVKGWNLRRGNPALEIINDLPDRLWFDSFPVLMFETRGEQAKIVIKKLDKVLKNYPYKNEYTLWPGPNSNTFVEYVIRMIPELTVELPAHAIGKDYQPLKNIVSKSPGGKGFQVSFLGALGFTLGLSEGIEINILGLNFGVDILNPAIKLPIIGRFGVKDSPL